MIRSHSAGKGDASRYDIRKYDDGYSKIKRCIKCNRMLYKEESKLGNLCSEHIKDKQNNEGK